MVNPDKIENTFFKLFAIEFAIIVVALFFLIKL